MPDGLDAILRLVAEGRLSAEEAAPLVQAMMAAEGGTEPAAPPPAPPAPGASMPDHVRLTVTERGRTVVNLRVPLALGKAAVNLVPGLSLGDSARVEAALAAGRSGSLLDVTDENGDGVRLVLE